MIQQDNNLFAKIFERNISRKSFIRTAAAALAVLGASFRKSTFLFAKQSESLQPRSKKSIQTLCDISSVKGEDPRAITRKAVDNLGGMSRFIKKGYTVVIKPNIGWDRSPEQAANTNPLVVAELVKMAKESGAKVVKVFDNTCNDSRRTYDSSGIMEAAKKEGALVFYVSDWKFIPGKFPEGALMAGWPVFRDAVECDCFINVPIAKHHGLTNLSLSMKNLMGVCGDRRGMMHMKIDKKLPEVTAFINPDLTVIDAYRILLRNGPTGGDIEDVELKKTVFAGTDPVLCDAYACGLFGIKPEEIGYIRQAYANGIGKTDLQKAKIKHIAI